MTDADFKRIAENGPESPEEKLLYKEQCKEDALAIWHEMKNRIQSPSFSWEEVDTLYDLKEAVIADLFPYKFALYEAWNLCPLCLYFMYTCDRCLLVCCEYSGSEFDRVCHSWACEDAESLLEAIDDLLQAINGW